MRATEQHRPRESNKEEKRKSVTFFLFSPRRKQQRTYKVSKGGSVPELKFITSGEKTPVPVWTARS
jgi:hypothetical protein